MSTTEAEESECAVLGAALASTGAYQEISDYLEERDFYPERHRLIFRAMRELAEEGNPIDVISVKNKLKEHTCLTRCGGATYLSTLTDHVPDVVNIRYYADEIKKVSLARDLRVVGGNLSRTEETPREDLAKAFERLAELADRAIVSNEESVGDLSGGLLREVLDGEQSSGNGLRIGFSELDKDLWGLHKGDLVILAARPSIGKSAFTLQVCSNIAKQNSTVLFISPEMSKQQLIRRLLSLESGVSYQRILKSQYISKVNAEALNLAHERISTLPLVIDDSSRQTLQDVRIKARRMQARRGLDLLVIDYLQLLGVGDDSYSVVSEISFGLKSLAKDLQIPVWAVSQMSRGVAQRDNRRPELSDLRGSGQLEQDADAVLFLWHPDQKDRSKVEIFIEKHRNGPLGAATYKFDKDTTKFVSGAW